MFGIGATELLLILVIAFFIFGPKKLPEMGKALGKGIMEFRKTFQDVRDTTSEVKTEFNQIRSEVSCVKSHPILPHKSLTTETTNKEKQNKDITPRVR